MASYTEVHCFNTRILTIYNNIYIAMKLYWRVNSESYLILLILQKYKIMGLMELIKGFNVMHMQIVFRNRRIIYFYLLE
jgi:hypothetical protein